MKKLLVAILLICLCLNLCACEKSEEAQNVDDLILSIGEVSLSDKSNIHTAKEQYDMLPKSQKRNVKNYHILEDAIESLTVLETRLEENYLQVLTWLANNGAARESDDINNYGQVLGYYYHFNSSAGEVTICYDLNDSGEIDVDCRLEIEDNETVKERDYSTGISYHIFHRLKFNPTYQSLSYMWMYNQNSIYTLRYTSLAHGMIWVDDISKMSRSTGDYIIDGYEEEDMYFKNKSGYTDVRAEINKDLFDTMDLFEEFLTEKVGLEMKDIGFTSYS